MQRMATRHCENEESRNRRKEGGEKERGIAYAERSGGARGRRQQRAVQQVQRAAPRQARHRDGGRGGGRSVAMAVQTVRPVAAPRYPCGLSCVCVCECGVWLVWN